MVPRSKRGAGPANQISVIPTSKKSSPGKNARPFAALAASTSSQAWLAGLLLVAAIIFAYQPAGWRGGFVWDDDMYVTNNPLLTAPDGWWRIWFSLDSPSQYFPLTYSVFRIERALWGLNAAGYHWVNILLHSLNAVLVWRLLRKLQVPGAWFAAAVFALHPVQVESVAWVTELKNLLSLFFILLAVRAWLEFLEANSRRRWRFYALSVGLYALALLSKTTACTLPATLLLILWLQKKPINAPRLLQIAPFAALGVGMGLLAMWWERFHQGTQGQAFAIGILDRILIASRAIWFYAGKLIWPSNLTFSYPRWNIDVHNALAYGWLLACVAIAGVIALYRRRAGRSVEVAALYFVATLAPTLGFIMLYTFRYSFVADHYQYAASIGPIALATAALHRIGARYRSFNPRNMAALGAGCLLLLGSLTWKQCGMYENIEKLWRVTIARNPESFMAHYNLAMLSRQSGRVEEAISHYEKAAEIQPDFADAHNNLGNVLLETGRVDEALGQFQHALELRPGDALTESNLGNGLLQKGDIEAAIVHYQSAIKSQPTNAFFLNNLAWVRATCGKSSLRNGKEAVELAEQACRLTGDREPIMIGTLAAAYAEMGKFEEAAATAEKAHDLALALGRQSLAQKNRELMQLYQNRQPYREGTDQVKGSRTTK